MCERLLCGMKGDRYLIAGAGSVIHEGADRQVSIMSFTRYAAPRVVLNISAFLSGRGVWDIGHNITWDLGLHQGLSHKVYHSTYIHEGGWAIYQGRFTFIQYAILRSQSI